MIKTFKIKKIWFYTICLTLFSNVSFAQDFSDATIGFDVAKMTATLKMHGIQDKDIAAEIVRIRKMYKSQFVLMKNAEDVISQKTKAIKKTKNKTGRVLATTDISPTEKEALKAIFDSTDGNNWSNHSGWDFSTNVSSWDPETQTGWYGVTLSEEGYVISLNLTQNNLIGVIPTQISDLVALNYLYLGDNQLTGNMPIEMFKLTNLIHLNIGDNNLTGVIPTDIGKLNKLENLILWNNPSLGGAIPGTIGDLTGLTTLLLSWNSFSGNIPVSLCNLTALDSIWLQSNNLDGSIPQSIGNLINLVQLVLSNNRLEGEIPTSVQSLSKLDFLSLDLNHLSKAIPDITNLTLLNGFEINGNNFYFADFVNQYPAYKNHFSYFNYTPQSKTDTEETITGFTTGAVTLKMFTDGRFTLQDSFQWYKNGQEIPGATNREYTIPSLTLSDAGDYYCISKNPVIPDLILERNPIHLSVNTCNSKSGSIKVTSNKNCTNENVNFVFETSDTNLSYVWSINTVENKLLYTSQPSENGTFSYTFNTDGDYIVKLGVTDLATNCISYFPYNISISNCLPPELPEEVCMNKDITFSFDTSDVNLNYKWSITDSSGTIVNEVTNSTGIYTFAFNKLGTYTVNMKASNSSLCPETSFSKSVIVIDCTPCDYCASFDLIKSQNYLVSGWIKESNLNAPQGQSKNYDKGCISISFTGIDGTIISPIHKFYATGDIIDGWQRIVGQFEVPSVVDDMKLELLNESEDDRMVYFDDIRILPSKGNMKSFVYDQKTQRLMAELDENNYATFYEYDFEGGLVRIKKETEKGVFTIQETRSGNAINNGQ
jgi:hypothetical protein